MSYSFSPMLYHWFVRPKWFTKKYIHDHITSQFSFDNRSVLDFGCGTGANCRMSPTASYLGIDPDSRRIGFASRLFPDYEFRELSTEDLPVDDNSVDYVWIIAVLHHLPSELITHYLKEFRRVLKKDGQILVIEPYLCPKTPISNRFMQLYDRGQYIREEDHYLRLFDENRFSCSIHRKFRKCFLYNELFFSARQTTI